MQEREREREREMRRSCIFHFSFISIIKIRESETKMISNNYIELKTELKFLFHKMSRKNLLKHDKKERLYEYQKSKKDICIPPFKLLFYVAFSLNFHLFSLL